MFCLYDFLPKAAGSRPPEQKVSVIITLIVPKLVWSTVHLSGRILLFTELTPQGSVNHDSLRKRKCSHCTELLGRCARTVGFWGGGGGGAMYSTVQPTYCGGGWGGGGVDDQKPYLDCVCRRVWLLAAHCCRSSCSRSFAWNATKIQINKTKRTEVNPSSDNKATNSKSNSPNRL